MIDSGRLNMSVSRVAALVATLLIVLQMPWQCCAQNHAPNSGPRVEDKEHWYRHAQDQLNQVLEERLNTVKGPAKNVILFVGDGMGMSTITAGRILKGQKLGFTGEEYQLAFEKFPHIALAKVREATNSRSSLNSV
ncbi:Alkaline phosphatase [Trinorchestia longiramus]|nr:Alkaline phosphatase [Trinorchestia longiramus]